MATAQVVERPSVSQELRVASAALSAFNGKKEQTLRLADSDLPSLIPDNSSLKVRSVKFTDLKMGDLICVQMGNTFAVRRFVKTKVAKQDHYLLTAREGFGKKEALLRSSLIGKIESVQHQGQTFDPASREGAGKKFWGMLTEYGTHKAFGLFG